MICSRCGCEGIHACVGQKPSDTVEPGVALQFIINANTLRIAVKNLIEQKGSHNTEIAYKNLVKVYEETK